MAQFSAMLISTQRFFLNPSFVQRLPLNFRPRLSDIEQNIPKEFESRGIREPVNSKTLCRSRRASFFVCHSRRMSVRHSRRRVTHELDEIGDPAQATASAAEKKHTCAFRCAPRMHGYTPCTHAMFAIPVRNYVSSCNVCNPCALAMFAI